MRIVQRFQLKWRNANYAFKKVVIITAGMLSLLLLPWIWRLAFGFDETKVKTILPISDLSDADSRIAFERRQKIKEMMLHAWRNYELFAWGSNELRPITRRVHLGGVFGSHDLGATIVESLDTLHIMGLEEEYKRGRDWIELDFSLDNINRPLSVYDLNSRFLGSMLTLYSFTGDAMYLEKALHIANKLLPAFETHTGVPHSRINTMKSIAEEAFFGHSVLSEFGALHLEFYYLSDVTGNSTFRELVEKIRNVLNKMDKPNGLYPILFHATTGKWGRQHSSMGTFGGRFYDYLLKSWMQSGYTDKMASQMYLDAMQGIIHNMVSLNPKGQAYISDWKNGNLTQQMEQFTCFAGGLFALTAVQGLHKQSAKYAEIAMSITNICGESFRVSPTHLGPELIGFTDTAKNNINLQQKIYYTLRPEIIESYFVLWRLTHEQKYRDWGWEIVDALEKYCRTPNGYAGLLNVSNTDKPQHDDVQRSHFLAQTLKYLFLLFSDDYVMSLEEWVFNSGGHPLPIKGENIYYHKTR